MTDSPLTQRDVEALRTTLDKLDQTVANLPRDMEATYVRKDVYERDLTNINGGLLTLHKGVERNDGRWSRLAWFVGLIVLAAVLGLVVGTGMKP